jgi:hypothetical protein
MGMLARAEAPAAKRKKERREKLRHTTELTDKVMGRPPWGEDDVGTKYMRPLETSRYG